MKLKQAEIEEYDSIIAFYDDVTERTPDMAVYARWSKRKHPTLEGIKAYIEEGSMYLFKEDTVIVGAMAITMETLAIAVIITTHRIINLVQKETIKNPTKNTQTQIRMKVYGIYQTVT